MEDIISWLNSIWGTKSLLCSQGSTGSTIKLQQGPFTGFKIISRENKPSGFLMPFEGIQET